MPEASGATAELLLLAARPVAMLREPLEPDGDGWWRLASPIRRFLARGVPVTVEQADGTPVACRRVEHLAGRVEARGEAPLYASGGFLPFAAAATAASWRLETSLARRSTSSLGAGYGSHRSILTGATVALAGVDWLLEPAAGDAVAAVLHAGAVVYTAVAACPSRRAADIRLDVDPDDLLLPTAPGGTR